MRKSGAMVKDAREALGISQWSLAQHLGYSSPQMVSNCERKLCSIPLGKVAEISKFLGMNAKALSDQIVREIIHSRTKDKK